MRRFENRVDAQKKQYYADRFFVPQSVEREAFEGGVFEGEIAALTDAKAQILEAFVEFGQLVVYVNALQNFTALSALKNFGYEQLSDLGAVDFIAQKGGYEVFYQLLSISKNRRTRVKCFVSKSEMLRSVTQVYACANWAEREMYDMSGVLITQHPNLKRLLMPDDWVGHPLLKSYPLQGDEHARWYEVDRIFGRERRDEIGEENRDAAFIDSKDTLNFAKFYRDNDAGALAKDLPQEEYQEKGGVKFVKKIKRGESEILKDRP